MKKETKRIKKLTFAANRSSATEPYSKNGLDRYEIRNGEQPGIVVDSDIYRSFSRRDRET